jgi:hypothetical protein
MISHLISDNARTGCLKNDVSTAFHDLAQTLAQMAIQEV